MEAICFQFLRTQLSNCTLDKTSAMQPPGGLFGKPCAPSTFLEKKEITFFPIRRQMWITERFEMPRLHHLSKFRTWAVHSSECVKMKKPKTGTGNSQAEFSCPRFLQGRHTCCGFHGQDITELCLHPLHPYTCEMSRGVCSSHELSSNHPSRLSQRQPAQCHSRHLMVLEIPRKRVARHRGQGADDSGLPKTHESDFFVCVRAAPATLKRQPGKRGNKKRMI